MELHRYDRRIIESNQGDVIIVIITLPSSRRPSRTIVLVDDLLQKSAGSFAVEYLLETLFKTRWAFVRCTIVRLGSVILLQAIRRKDGVFTMGW